MYIMCTELFLILIFSLFSYFLYSLLPKIVKQVLMRIRNVRIHFNTIN
jgi:hypothetical protein